MSHVIKAVLSSASHPENGQITVPFPIPDEAYDHTMELLETVGIGDTLAQDCQVDDMDSFYTVLDWLKGSSVNVDELDYLAKRLDSFDDGEAAQFQAMSHRLEIDDVKDFINLTFCCQRATVITNFSNLEAIGREHCMNLHDGAMPLEEYDALDGRKEALHLIQSGQGVVTPYGVAYDNGMKLEPLYDGRHFPGYLYKVPVLVLEASSIRGGVTGILCLPMSDQQLQRQRIRTEAGSMDTRIRITMDELPEKMMEALDLEHVSSDDLPALNRLCQAIAPMKDADTEKLNAVVLMTEAADIIAVCQLAENLDQFDFIPGIQTPEEYGRYMIQESGHFDYDENLEGFYDYRLYGEQRIREEGGQFNKCGYVAYHGTLTLDELMRADPAEQYQQESGMQML